MGAQIISILELNPLVLLCVVSINEQLETSDRRRRLLPGRQDLAPTIIRSRTCDSSMVALNPDNQQVP